MSNVTQTGDSVTFDVDHTGAPVLIRVSDFPGWTVAGADGPFRVTPNFLVVVPTEKSVSLTRTRTTVDWVALVSGTLGVIGVVGLAVMSWRDRRRRVTTN